MLTTEYNSRQSTPDSLDETLEPRTGQNTQKSYNALPSAYPTRKRDRNKNVLHIRPHKYNNLPTATMPSNSTTQDLSQNKGNDSAQQHLRDPLSKNKTPPNSHNKEVNSLSTGPLNGSSTCPSASLSQHPLARRFRTTQTTPRPIAKPNPNPLYYASIPPRIAPTYVPVLHNSIPRFFRMPDHSIIPDCDPRRHSFSMST